MGEKLIEVRDLEDISHSLCLDSFLTRRTEQILLVTSMKCPLIHVKVKEVGEMRGDGIGKRNKKEDLERKGELIINHEVRIRNRRP